MNSENVKKVSFLKNDCCVHHDYQLIKTGTKHVFNLPKNQVYQQHHSSIHDFTINPKNTYNEYAFTGNSWYDDFDLPKIPYSYESFVLRFNLTSRNTNDDFYVLPYPMMIERLV